MWREAYKSEDLSVVYSFINNDIVVVRAGKQASAVRTMNQHACHVARWQCTFFCLHMNVSAVGCCLQSVGTGIVNIVVVRQAGTVKREEWKPNDSI